MKGRAALAGIELLLVDGDNLLHEARGRRDEGGVAWLLPRLSRWRPESLRIVVALDGHPAPGESRRRRAARGVEFQYSGSRTADDLLIDLVSAQPYASRARSAVVTGDRALADRARRAGALTRTVGWLVSHLDRSAGSAPGASMPAHGPDIPTRGPQEEPSGWRSGRGATRKTGNPHRAPKPSRRR